MREKTVTLGSLLTAFLSSLCCIGPLILALLGIGGLGFVTQFERYRPFFIVLTILLLGGAFSLTYGRRTACGPGNTCERRGVGRLQHIVLWTATGVALLLMGFPYLIRLFLS